MDSGIQVQHIFNFTLAKSFRNGIRKTKYWSIYSLKNKDLLSDSGTASQEFKFNVLSCFANLVFLFLGLLLHNWIIAVPALPLYGINLYLNRRLIRAFHKTGGLSFAICAVLYYTFLYPFAVGIGAFSGISVNISVSSHDFFTFSPPGFYPVEKKTYPVHLFFNPQV
jgi:hypothetical protein